MMNYTFLDTSAVLNNGLKKYPHAYISLITLNELENIKSSNKKDDQIKYLARNAARDIASTAVQYNFTSQKQIDKLLKKHDFLQNINDHRILCEAELLGIKHGEMVLFITCDTAQYLFSQQLPHLMARLITEKNDDADEYCGWSQHFVSNKQLARLYSEPTNNLLSCKINEYAEIYQDEKLQDILLWTGEKYRPLKYKEFTSTLGERVGPRNLEQKMYLDLLQDKSIPIKLCIAKFGTGKSWLALSWALHEVQLGNYDKIVFIKNNLEVKGAGKLGILPGDEFAKQLPWLRQIEDHIGPQNFETMIDNGQIEPAHLSTLRGRDLKNCIILADEAENLLDTNIQLLLGRVAENSQIIFCADIKQCDYDKHYTSGIPKMIERLSGQPLFGMVKLLKTERSAVAAMADLLD